MADTLRITLELELADNPPLFRDLASFPKGPRRVNRLRTLAHAGLIAQLVPQRSSHEDTPPATAAADAAVHAASLELFGPATDT